MKQISLFLFLFFCIVYSSFSQGVNIIPRPLHVEANQGQFEINSNTKIYFNTTEGAFSADFLHSFFSEHYGLRLLALKGTSDEGIRIITDKSFKKEAYELTVNKKGITIKGDVAGLFYGLQSLLQMMPVESQNTVSIQQVSIKDEPRFSYRGAMLDCGRYFFTPQDVKRFIDLMAHYKLNIFHWHLTEDGGWRIESKKYPLLTKIGAWRRGTQSFRVGDESFDRLPHGGYYTEKQIREIVQYAQARNITVVPEIDMPGHTLSILAAYPEVSCTGGPFKVLEHWGIQKDVLCAGNEKTYEMIEGLLDELLDMFPSKIIHVGGDEAPKDRWKECPKCQAKIRSEKLKDEHELQSYFITRVGKYLQSKGRRMLGWDEIMEGGLAPNAMVMSWRGVEGGIAASKMHHEVVMAPNTYMYLDYYQGPRPKEPFNIGGTLPLEKVYIYEPLSPRIPVENQKYVIGIQGNIWMEFIHSVPKLDYMGFPRLLAVSEIGWSTKEKNYVDFLSRLSYNLQWLDKKNVNFRIPDPQGLKDSITSEKQLTVKLTPPVHESEIYYTLNGDDPMEKGIRYTAPVKIDLTATDSLELKCIVRTQTGRVSSIRSAKYKLK